MQQVQELRKIETGINYAEDTDRLKRFILFFKENDELKYLDQIRTSVICINLADLSIFDPDLTVKFERNAYSYTQLAYKVIDDILFNDEYIQDIQDVFLLQRIAKFKENFPDKKITEVLTGQLLRNYTIRIIPRLEEVYTVRELKSTFLGQLVRVRGIVTKISNVKPSMRVATYICEACGTEFYQSVENDTFDLLGECFSEKCRMRKIRSSLTLVTRGSKFMKFQHIQIQELSGDVPSGCIPRMINVEAFESLTEIVRPGEYVILSGIFLPKPYYGIKKLKAGLLNDIYIHCTDIQQINASHIDPSVLTNIPMLPINKLVESFAPEIFGMTQVKKILLLMLAGSTPIIREDGMKIRGNINVLLVGDPGIAKSQLLKTVVKISKRGIYTTGKGSSGVGLTASVNKDPLTGEVILEGGALVIADKGVCCIDELDKMNDLDRVAIHEVMEQQTVSISKAGINTTLNARCAILGAANPKGRFDAKKSIEQNIGFPISLISRFDVIVVLKDDSSDKDLEMASHITNLHLTETQPEYDYTFLKHYIEKCKEINPRLCPSLKDKLVSSYLESRSDSHVTPRMLLSLIRISIAHARLRMSEVVEDEDVNEAISLLESIKLPKGDRQEVSWKYTIYNHILSLAEKNGDEMVVDLKALFTNSNFPEAQIRQVITEFSNSGIWNLTDENELRILN